MSDLISRADAIEAVHGACNYCDTCDLKDIGCSQIQALSALPSAEAVQGEWIRISNDWIDGTCGARYFPIRCSVCGHSTYDDDATNFCPTCGAKMLRKDGDDKNENNT